MTDLEHRLRHALTRGCRLYIAREIVMERFRSGAYPMLSRMTPDVLEFMARALADNEGRE